MPPPCSPPRPPPPLALFAGYQRAALLPPPPPDRSTTIPSDLFPPPHESLCTPTPPPSQQHPSNLPHLPPEQSILQPTIPSHHIDRPSSIAIPVNTTLTNLSFPLPPACNIPSPSRGYVTSLSTLPKFSVPCNPSFSLFPTAPQLPSRAQSIRPDRPSRPAPRTVDPFFATPTHFHILAKPLRKFLSRNPVHPSHCRSDFPGSTNPLKFPTSPCRLTKTAHVRRTGFSLGANPSVQNSTIAPESPLPNSFSPLFTPSPSPPATLLFRFPHPRQTSPL